MTKKVLAIVLAAILVVSTCSVLLTACSKSDTAATTAPTAAATTAATTAAATTAPANNNSSAAGNDKGNDSANNDTAQSANNDAASSADIDEDSDTVSEDEKILHDYEGDTNKNFQDVVDTVLNLYGSEDDTATYVGKVQTNDGAVWFNVLINDSEGNLVGSYYVDDAGDAILTTVEMEAYAMEHQ